MNLDNSFDEKESAIDLTSVIAEFPEGDDHPGQMIPIKKLSEAFDGCVKSDEFLKVFLRVRPINSKLENTISVESDNSIVTTAPDSSRRAQYTKQESRNYIFSKVFGPTSQQNEVFEQSALPLLNRLLLGDNCVLFAYGMTNAGKTYTIQGSNQDPGILPRVIASILDKSVGTGTKYDLHISMLEIYQEKIYDLLGKVKEKLSIRDGNGRVEVNKLSAHSISSVQDALRLMDQAAAKRSKSTTCLNSGSSRSHAVYTLTVSHGHSSSAFHVVDLAGAERGNRTKATLVQQKEANNINVSLMQLWRCLQGMRRNSNSHSNENNNSNNDNIIPFRESKLTHLLMPILSRAGSAGVAMIACVNPQGDDYDETLSVLGNASIASKIREIVDLGRNNNISHNNNSTVNLNATTVSTATITNAIEVGVKRKSVHQPAVAGLAKKRSLACKPVVALQQQQQLSIPQQQQQQQQHVEADKSESPSDEVLRLREEVISLRESNQLLLSQSLTRESEIRMEVSGEMAVRSSHLLQQIQELRDQLATFESGDNSNNSGGGRNNVKKSAKKARKRQIDDLQHESTEDLREAEEELERVKSVFEGQVSELQRDKAILIEELNMLKKNGVVAVVGQTQQQQQQQQNSVSFKDKLKSVEALLGSAGANTAGSGSLLLSSSAVSFQGVTVTANEFQKRFQKNNENHYNNNNTTKTNNYLKSPNRSPLSPMSKNIVNSPNPQGRVSPMKRDNNNNSNNNNQQNNKPVFAVKKVDNFSPQRLRPVEDNNNQNYISRLRSNFMKV